MVDAAGLRGWRRRHSVCNVRAHPRWRLGTGSLGLLRAGVGTIRQWVAPGPDRPGRGPVYGEGLRPGSLVRLAGPCLGAKPLVSRRHLIPAPVRAAGGLNGLVHHRLLTNRPARGAGCSSWVLRTLPRPPRASAWVADSGVSSSRPTIRSLPFLPWSSGPPGSAGLVRRLSCPGSGVAGAWRAQRGCGGHSSKNTRPGDRAQATVQRTGGDYPLGVTLWLSVVNGWQTGSVLSPGLRPAVRRPVVRTAVSTSGPPAKASPFATQGGRDFGISNGVGLQGRLRNFWDLNANPPKDAARTAEGVRELQAR